MNDWECGSCVSCSKWECGSAVGGDPNRKLPQLVSWCLSGSLTSGSGLWLASTGSSKPRALLMTGSQNWIATNQSDINCQFLQQVKTSPNHLHHSRQTEPSDQKVQGGHFEPDSNSWMQSGVVAHCSDGGRRSPSQGFPFQTPPWEGSVFLQFTQNCEVIQRGGVQDFAPCPGVVVMVRLNGRVSLLTLNIRVFQSVSRLCISVGRSLNATGTPCTLIPPGVYQQRTLEHFGWCMQKQPTCSL